MPSFHRAAGLSAGATQNLLLAIDVNRSILAEHAPGQPSRLACCPYGSLPGRSRLAFNGEFREPQGWYHLGNGHRLYNPALRRFNRPDHLSPFGKGGINPYAYCLGDPVNFTDPSGRIAEFWKFFKDVFYEVPSANLVLTSGLLLLNVVTAIVLPPVTPLGYLAMRSGIAGATLGVIGSTTQMAGVTDAGRAISIVGTIFSGVSVLSRVGLGVQKLRKEWLVIRKDLGPRVRNIFVGGYRKPLSSPRGTPMRDIVHRSPMPQAGSTPAGSPATTSIGPTTPSPLPRSASMTDVGARSPVLSTSGSLSNRSANLRRSSMSPSPSLEEISMF